MTQKNNHDSYIDAAPRKFQSLLQNVRAQLSQALPDAEEIIAYDMPGYEIGGKVIAGYAAFSRQCGLYVDPAAIAAYSDEIASLKLKASKTGVTFSEGNPIPDELTRKLAVRSRKAKGV